METKTYKQIKGFLPALAVTTPETPFVLDGSNFMIDAQGPYSTWYNKLLTYAQIATGAGTTTFRTKDDLIIVTAGAMLRYDSFTQRYYPVYLFTDDGTVWPWSFAEVAGKYYFAKKGVTKIIRYDPDTNGWSQVDDTFTPDGIVGICAAGGHLVCLGSINVGWSSLDDGTDFEESLETGAGFQGLSLISGRDYPLGVFETTDGFITYTQKGIMKSEFAQGPSPFRHYAMTKNYIPLTPFLIAPTADKEHIILDRKGLFITNGATFQPYAALFSEFLQKTFLTNFQQQISLAGYPILRLYWYDSSKFLFLSVANASRPDVFLSAYVYYSNIDEWGSFNYPHYGFGELNLSETVLKGYNFAYLDLDGYYRIFISDIIIQSAPDKSTYDFYQPTFELPIRMDESTLVGGSFIKMTEVDETILFGLPGGLYDLNLMRAGPEPADFATSNTEYVDSDSVFSQEDWMTIPDGTADEDYDTGVGTFDWGGTTFGLAFSSTLKMATSILEESSLRVPIVSEATNSYVSIGTFRLSDQQRTNELSTITDVAISGDVYPGNTELLDYMDPVQFAQDVIEDWLTAVGDEDWGVNSPQTVDFTAVITGTTDGYTIFEKQQQTLHFEYALGARRVYSTFNTGLFNKLNINAFEVGSSYHVKLLEVQGTLAGNFK